MNAIVLDGVTKRFQKVVLRTGYTTLKTAQTSGARLSMTLSGVRSGQRCNLVIESADGRREVPASWQATYAGEATVTGSTSVTPERISRMLVATPEGATLLQLWKAP